MRWSTIGSAGLWKIGSIHDSDDTTPGPDDAGRKIVCSRRLDRDLASAQEHWLAREQGVLALRPFAGNPPVYFRRGLAHISSASYATRAMFDSGMEICCLEKSGT